MSSITQWHQLRACSILKNLTGIKALELLGITEAQLPQLVPTTHILKGMKKRYATLMGIDENTPIIVGASDGVL